MNNFERDEDVLAAVVATTRDAVGLALPRATVLSGLGGAPARDATEARVLPLEPNRGSA